MKNVVLGTSVLAIAALATTVLLDQPTSSDVGGGVIVNSASVGADSNNDVVAAGKENNQTPVGNSGGYAEDQAIRREQAALESEAKLKEMVAEYERVRTDADLRKEHKEKMAAQLAEHSENVLPLALEKLREEENSETTD